MDKRPPKYMGSRFYTARAPSQTTLEGPRSPGNKVRMARATKPPPLRFKPGSYVKFRGFLYEIMYVYRVAAEPHEWMYELEERKDLYGKQDALATCLSALGAGSTTPRICYEIFHDHGDARQFFSDIPCNADRAIGSNKQMMAEAERVSSGRVE